MREGPERRLVCIGCKFYKKFNDWKDGDYYFCEHPRSMELSGTPDRIIFNGLTPEWCPVVEVLTS